MSSEIVCEGSRVSLWDPSGLGLFSHRGFKCPGVQRLTGDQSIAI